MQEILSKKPFSQNQGPVTSVSPYTHHHQSLMSLRFEILSNVVMTHYIRLVPNHVKPRHPGTPCPHNTPVSQKTLETPLSRSGLLLTQVCMRAYSTTVYHLWLQGLSHLK